MISTTSSGTLIVLLGTNALSIRFTIDAVWAVAGFQNPVVAGDLGAATLSAEGSASVQEASRRRAASTTTLTARSSVAAIRDSSTTASDSVR